MGGAVSVVLPVVLKVAALVAVPVPVSALSLEVMSLAVFADEKKKRLSAV